MRSPSAFWFELRRRNVVRAAVLYVGAVWALAQGMAQLAPVFGLPDSLTRWFVLACTLGFPFWLVLAWLYELTPTGLKREADVEPNPVPDVPRPRSNRRLLDYAIIAVLSVAVVLLATNALFGRKAIANRAGATDLAAAFTRIPEKSVAVLPMVDPAANRNEQYFSDGISEDLITALSGVAGLKVIGRNSAFQFRGREASPAEIGARLGVAHLLEGSVSRDGATLRVRVELIKAVDGSTVWSQLYVRPYRDLFRVQDEITLAVSNALQAKLLQRNDATPQTDRPPGGSLAAYNAYLQGRAHYKQGTEESSRLAVASFATAIRLDPHYARAYAATSSAWTYLGRAYLGGAAQREAYARSRSAVQTALAMNPDSAAAYGARGYLRSTADMDWSGAEADLQRVLQLTPNDATAKYYLADLLATLGQVQQAVALTRQALDREPYEAGWHASLASYLAALGQLDEAGQEIHTAMALQPRAAYLHYQLTLLEIQRGDAVAALAAATQEVAGVWRDMAVALARQAGTDPGAADATLQGLIDRWSENAAYQIAEAYALRNDAENTFKWLDRAWVNGDPGISILLYDPIILRYRGSPRLAAFCAKVNLPTPDGTAASAATAALGASAR